jgi:cytochrome c553
LAYNNTMPKPLVTVMLSASIAFGAQSVFAQATPKPPAGKAPNTSVNAPEAPHPGTENFHAQCIGCHGIPGYKTAYPLVYHVPKIAGQQPAYIVAALKAYKSGERSHPSMRGIAASLSEEDMQKLAEYYGAPAK